MNARSRLTPHRRLVRVLVVLIAAADLVVGVMAFVAPHFFYRHVVGVDLLGSYNEHLLTDVGEFYLAFGLLMTWAARTLDPILVRPACVAQALVAGLHLGYHAAHLEHFSAAEATAEIAGLIVGALLPVAALTLSRTRQRGDRDKESATLDRSHHDT